jgi:PHO85 cyclin-6/7
VGGLPQAELNQLELQFLLLNDFNLVVSQCEMQRYAVQLIAYAAGKTPLLPPPISPPHSTAMLPAEEVTPNINGFIQHAEAAQSTTSLASSRTDDTDDEDATVRPPHSCEASETSSLATADSDEEEEGEADDDDSDDTNSDSPSPSLRAPSLVQRISASV